MAEELGGAGEGAALFFGGGVGGVGHAPVGDDGLAGPDGAGFFGVVAEGDDEVKVNVVEFVPGFAACGGGVDAEILLEDGEGHGVGLAFGRGSGADGVEAAGEVPAGDEFGEDAAGGIAGAEEEESVGAVHGVSGWGLCGGGKSGGFPAEGVEALGAAGIFVLPGDDHEGVGEGGDFGDEVAFAVCLAAEAIFGGAGGGEALVENPGAHADAGAFEILLEAGGFVDGCGLGQGNEQHTGEGGIAEFGEEGADFVGEIAAVAEDFAVVGFGGVEEEEGVAGGGGVEDDKAVVTAGHGAGEGLEDGDFLGAGGAEFLFEEFAAGGIQVAWGGGEDLFDVALGFGFGVDAVQIEIGEGFAEGGGDMGGGVGGGEVHGVAAEGEAAGDGGGEGGFADAAFAHGHDDTRAAGLELVEEGVEADVGGEFRGWGGEGGERGVLEEAAEGVGADEAAGAEGAAALGQVLKSRGDSSEDAGGAFGPGAGEGVGEVAGFVDAVEDEVEAADAFVDEFAGGAVGLFQGGDFGAADEENAGLIRIAEGLHGACVVDALFFEAGEGAEA